MWFICIPDGVMADVSDQCLMEIQSSFGDKRYHCNTCDEHFADVYKFCQHLIDLANEDYICTVTHSSQRNKCSVESSGETGKSAV